MDHLVQQITSNAWVVGKAVLLAFGVLVAIKCYLYARATINESRRPQAHR
jgi:hypothetical protein